MTETRPGRLISQRMSIGRAAIEHWALAVRSHQNAPDPNAARQGRILVYHSVGTPRWGINDVRPVDFERHLQIAADDGWSFATPEEVSADPAKPQVAITFDDGLVSTLVNAVPVLRHHGIPATAFVVTAWADGQTPDWCQKHLLLDWRGVAALQDGGVKVASHSVTHQDFGKLSLSEARRELELSRQRLYAVLGVDTDEFAIPFGSPQSWTAAAHQAALEAGYKTIYAQCVANRPKGTVPRTFITRADSPFLFRAALAGAYDNWLEHS